MRIMVVNQSKACSDADVGKMAAACALQVKRDFSPAWGRLPVDVVAGSLDHVLPSDDVITILDKPDQPGALGYHTETGGKEWGKIFCDPVLGAGGVVLKGATPDVVTVSSVLSHEVLELLGDPFCNAWVDGRKLRQGNQYAAEVCDPCEADSYEIDGVMLSNFVLPAWFDGQAHPGSKFDFMHKLTAPFSMTKGGYMVIRSTGLGAKESQVFGYEYAEWRRTMKAAHPGSRGNRRMLRTP